MIILKWVAPSFVDGNGPDLPLPARDLTFADLAEKGISVEQALRSGLYEKVAEPAPEEPGDLAPMESDE